jgi:P27 family predicted phage terminase small subunit
VRGGARRNKPEALRALHGSRTRPRHRGSIPVDPVETLEPPPELTDLEREHWAYYERKLTKTKVLTSLDRDALANYCIANGQIREIRQAQKDPTYRRVLVSETVDDAGNRQFKVAVNPLDAQLRQWMQIARLAGSELGLSPVSRARVAPAGTTQEQDELDTYINAPLRAVK